MSHVTLKVGIAEYVVETMLYGSELYYAFTDIVSKGGLTETEANDFILTWRKGTTVSVVRFVSDTDKIFLAEEDILTLSDNIKIGFKEDLSKAFATLKEDESEVTTYILHCGEKRIELAELHLHDRVGSPTCYAADSLIIAYGHSRDSVEFETLIGLVKEKYEVMWYNGGNTFVELSTILKLAGHLDNDFQSIVYDAYAYCQLQKEPFVSLGEKYKYLLLFADGKLRSDELGITQECYEEDDTASKIWYESIKLPLSYIDNNHHAMLALDKLYAKMRM